MVGLLFMVVFVSVVYEVLVVAIVVAGTRLQRAAEDREDLSKDLTGPFAPMEPAPPPAASSPPAAPVGVPTMAAGRWGVVALRASDGERDATADRIAAAMGEGRLSLDEGTARLDQTYRARDRVTLERLVADLPQPTPPARATDREDGGSWLRAAVLLTVVTATVAQVVAGAWVLWPVAVGLLLPLARARRR